MDSTNTDKAVREIFLHIASYKSSGFGFAAKRHEEEQRQPAATKINKQAQNPAPSLQRFREWIQLMQTRLCAKSFFTPRHAKAARFGSQQTGTRKNKDNRHRNKDQQTGTKSRAPFLRRFREWIQLIRQSRARNLSSHRVMQKARDWGSQQTGTRKNKDNRQQQRSTNRHKSGRLPSKISRMDSTNTDKAVREIFLHIAPANFPTAARMRVQRCGAAGESPSGVFAGHPACVPSVVEA